VIAAFAPPPRLTVSQWADQHRRLSPEASAEAGEWRTDRAPYQRAILDALTPSSSYERIVFMSSSQVGKCLALDTPLPTPEGWTTMGAVRVDDRLFDDLGRPCRVVGTSEVFLDRVCYRIRFEDGEEVVADAGHQWAVHDRKHDYKLRLVTTEEMASSVVSHHGNRKSFRFRIECAGALELPDAVLPVDPYVLGAWLGDGNSHSAQITCDVRDGVLAELKATGTDAFVVQYDRRRPHVASVQIGPTRTLAHRTHCQRGHRLEGHETGSIRCPVCAVLHGRGFRRRRKERAGQARLFPELQLGLQPVNRVGASDTMHTKLMQLGVLPRKHIPASYLRASRSQRLALLQGLLDTDGSAGPGIEFTNTNQRLAEGFQELAISLGFKPAFKVSRSKLNGKDCGPKYRIHFTAYQQEKPFRLARKLMRLRSLTDPAARFTESRRRSIVSIERVPTVPVRCIAVDSPSRLFLAGRGMIPTHNTECLNSFVGYVIDQDPGPILVVQPRVEDGEAWSKDRLAPMLRDTPCLRGKVADVRSRDANNRILHKRFQGGSITIAGANSPAGLAMRPIRYVLLDEVDRYPPSAGTEGDPVSLAIKRSTTWWNRKILLVSSPTVKGASRIESWWLRSNQSSFWVPCPECGTFQILVWPGMEWPEAHPEEVQYRCNGCHALIPPYRKPWMLARGEWRAAKPKSKIAGFWISQLYSPWKEWGETAVEFLEAKAGGPETLRAFINTALAELWDDEAETSVDIAVLLGRREVYGPRLPAGVCTLTAGVDVQLDRIELELVGWGKGEESWSIEYQVFPGDPSAPDVWRSVDAFLNRQWPHEYGISLPVAACSIDSGFHTQAVYEFCRTRYHRRILAIKGKGGSLPVWPKRPTRNTIHKTPLWIVGVDSAKSVIYGRLKIDQPGPGYAHFPAERTAEWFEQLLSETLVTSYSRGVPVREWRRKKGVRAEVLDARVYAYAALCGLISMGLRLDAEADRIEALRPVPGQERKSAPSGDGVPARKVLRSRWINGGGRGL